MKREEPFSAAVDFAISKFFAQEQEIIAQGEDLEWFAPNVPADLRDSDQVMPDLVELFIDLVNLGMFSDSNSGSVRHSAKLVRREFDRDHLRQRWIISIDGAGFRAYRVLLNALLARHLNSVSIKTVAVSDQPPEPGSIARNPSAEYPGIPRNLPFYLDHVEPERAFRNRVIRIVFAQEPDDSLLELVYQVLEKWTHLLLLGAYPPQNVHPARACVVPDIAYLADPVTVEQGFSEAFLCDEAAFAPILNWLVQLDRSGIAVKQVEIR